MLPFCRLDNFLCIGYDKQEPCRKVRYIVMRITFCQWETKIMYSLVIAEDEFTTRRALVNMIRWNELGFQVDGEFSDGRELLDYLKSNIPDVILTDIKMTQVGGLEIARLVSEQNLPIRIVFLSGHKEFSYAQEAVEYHVAHYLLKPIDLSRLREVFRSIREKLDVQSAQEDLLQNRRDHYSRLVNYEKQQFVTDAWFGALSNPEQMAARLRLIQARTSEDGTERQFLVRMVLRKDGQYQEFLDNYGQQELQEQIIHILEYFDRRLEYYPITWSNIEEGLAVLGVFWESEADRPGVYYPEELEKSIYDLMAVQAKVTTFQKLSSPEELAHYTENVGRKEPANHLVQDKEYLQLLRDQKKLLYSYLCQNNAVQVRELTGALLNNYLRGGVAFAQSQCIHTVTKLIDEITGHDLMEWNQLYGKCMNPLPALQAEGLRTWLEDCVGLLYEYMTGQSDTKEDTSIEKVMEYLRLHYSEDITLNTVAEAVFLNPVYISRLIKEQTGRNYTELVMEMRVEQAVELLEHSDMYVYEIAEKVGYNNLKYFYKVFRKVKGKSPSDYRA